MIDYDIDVKYIVDPGPSGYDIDPINRFVKWLEDWDRPCLPSGRYNQIKNYGVFWGGHRFYIGLSNLDDAVEFNMRWGGFLAPGILSDSGRFILDNTDDIIDQNNWKICMMRIT